MEKRKRITKRNKRPTRGNKEYDIIIDNNNKYMEDLKSEHPI